LKTRNIRDETVALAVGAVDVALRSTKGILWPEIPIPPADLEIKALCFKVS
jgi:hypothetical protein